jgi:hypothetical protein
MSAFNENYYTAVTLTAKEQGKTLSDYAKKKGLANISYAYRKLKESNPAQLQNGIEPFKMLGAKVEVIITCKSGKKIILK